MMLLWNLVFLLSLMSCFSGMQRDYESVWANKLITRCSVLFIDMSGYEESGRLYHIDGIVSRYEVNAKKIGEKKIRADFRGNSELNTSLALDAGDKTVFPAADPGEEYERKSMRQLVNSSLQLGLVTTNCFGGTVYEWMYI